MEMEYRFVLWFEMGILILSSGIRKVLIWLDHFVGNEKNQSRVWQIQIFGVVLGVDHSKNPIFYVLTQMYDWPQTPNFWRRTLRSIFLQFFYEDPPRGLFGDVAWMSSPPRIKGWGLVIHLGRVGQNRESLIFGSTFQSKKCLKWPQQSEFAIREFASGASCRRINVRCYKVIALFVF